MHKFFIFITLLCVSLALARRQNGGQAHHGGGGGGGGGGNRFPSGGDNARLTSKLCANSSLAQSFLSQTQAAITQLSSNGSFTQFLQQKAQQVAYIQNSANAALLTSNCTQYFNGLVSAQNADMAVQRQQQEYQNVADRILQRIIATLLGFGNDSSEGK